jgi:CheY-specific phosphatase CheX
MDWNVVREALLDSTTALFKSYGIELSRDKPRVSPSFNKMTLAVIGFTSKEFNGSLVVSMDAALLHDSYPKVEGAEPDFFGWAGELANPLTGRLKNRLLSSGIVINLSIPTTIRGRGGAHRRGSRQRTAHGERRLVPRYSCSGAARGASARCPRSGSETGIDFGRRRDAALLSSRCDSSL